MHDGLQKLSEREVEVLRLLLAGHDAKSVARLLGLSVHTINERLREARRKLGVSSSREAARLWAEAQQQSSKSLVYKEFGVPGSLPQQHPKRQESRERAHPSFAWLAGGMLAMSLTIAALFVTFLGSDRQAEAVQTASDQTVSDVDGTIAFTTLDLMPIADTDGDGKVTFEEYRIFSEQGWGFATQGRDEVRLGELDRISQTAFVGITPAPGGVITRQMYIDAIPDRFRMLDRNGDGALSADELNGRAFQGPAPPPSEHRI